jgi:hypothetical protein
MALVLLDRVQQTGTANTTVSFTLTGSVVGFQDFTAIGNGNTTFYEGTDASGNWETGLGTYSTTGPTLTRTTILQSSNAGSAVTFTGAVNVFVTYPSSKSVNLDASGNVSPLGTVASGTWNGSTVGVAYGGTGVTASSGANSVVLRDSNANVTFNNFVPNSAIITASAGTTVLTVASARNQILVGATTHTFQLPDATTLLLGQSFLFINNSSGNLTVIDNASAVVEVVPPGGITQKGAVSIATTAGTWGAYSFIPAAVNWGTNSLYLDTTVISGGTWQGGTIATGYGGTGLTSYTSGGAVYASSSSTLTSGTLPVPSGGTGQTSFASGYIPYGDTTAALQSSASLQFNGTYLVVGGTTPLGGITNPITAFSSSANNFVQTYVYNATNGTSASADLVAYANNSDGVTGFVDMGFTSQTYADASYSVTGPNESYLFGSAASGSGTTGNLVYATDSTGTANSHQWYVGGFNQAKGAWKMQLTSTGLQLANALPIASGGTGQTTANAAFNALAPSQTSNSGKYLTTDGTNASWASIASGSTLNITEFTATTGQVTFSLTYTPGAVEGVYRNGIKLGSTDFTASTGTTIVLATGAVAGDLIQVVAFTTISIANTVSTFSGGTTGLTPSSPTNGIVTLAGTLNVANGGTGATTLTANNVLLGNGTSAVQVVAPGTSGNVLTSNGTTWTSATPSGGGGLGGQTVYTTAGSFTFTIPTGKTALKITVIGGGGGSGGTGAANTSSGGGAGGCAIKYLTGLTPGNTLSVTVGAAGTAGAASGGSYTTGGTGGTSSVASGTQTITTISATGGAGGTGAPLNDWQSGGNGGLGSNGDVNSYGGCGGNAGNTVSYVNVNFGACPSFSTVSYLTPGLGGASLLNSPYQNSISTSTAFTPSASVLGAGATGRISASNNVGIAGGVGVVIFEY